MAFWVGSGRAVQKACGGGTAGRAVLPCAEQPEAEGWQKRPHAAVRASQPLASAQRPWHRMKAPRVHLCATAAPVGRGLPTEMLYLS